MPVLQHLCFHLTGSRPFSSTPSTHTRELERADECGPQCLFSSVSSPLVPRRQTLPLLRGHHHVSWWVHTVGCSVVFVKEWPWRVIFPASALCGVTALRRCLRGTHEEHTSSQVSALHPRHIEPDLWEAEPSEKGQTARKHWRICACHSLPADFSSPLAGKVGTVFCL